MREENGFAFSAEETLALMTPETRLIILNSPANPTGGVTPREEIDKLVAALARRPNVAILSDEIYGQMTYDNHRCQTLLAYPKIRDRLILLDGWSKTYAMTGWRLGYSVWPINFGAPRHCSPTSRRQSRLARNPKQSQIELEFDGHLVDVGQRLISASRAGGEARDSFPATRNSSIGHATP